VRLTDLIRGAKTVSEDSTRTEEAEEKPSPTIPASETASSTPVQSQALPLPPIAVPAPPLSVPEPDIPKIRSWPECSLSQPRRDAQPAETPPAPVEPVETPRPVASQPSVRPVADPPPASPAPAPIRLRLSQPGPRESPPKVEDLGPSQIQLRALGRLSNRAPVPPLPEPGPPKGLLIEPFTPPAAPEQPTAPTPPPELPTAPTPSVSPVTPVAPAAPSRSASQQEASAPNIPVQEVLPPVAAAKRDKDQPDWYGLAEQELTRIGELVRNRQPFTVDEIQRIAAGMVESMQESDRLLTRAFSGQGGALLIANMVNVGIFAIKLGKGVGYHPDDLVRLGLAGLLHDVGMFLIPDMVLMRAGKLSAQEQTAVRQHPELGQQILSKLGLQYDWLAEVAHQEHERSSGRGYPRGLRENQIHEFARIVGLADVFEALLSPRPYRPRLLPHVAMRELLSAERQSFPHQLMKVLVEQFSVFPLGTTVRLNTGEVGVVTKLNPRHPLRPVVQVTQLPDRTVPSERKFVDLSTTTLVHVAVVETETI
jgi:HD-GYP domain-containing protein (c-di-GMP phosphodiesterase class II)